MLRPLKRSPEYAAIRRRIADPKPVDAWQLEMLHYFLFQLRPLKDVPESPSIPFALFTMRWEDDGPVSALVITPDARGEKAEVVDLCRPESVYKVPLSHQ